MMLKKIIITVLLLFGIFASEAETLKIATLVPNGTLWMRAFSDAATEIEKRTDGRVTLKFFPGGIMGNDNSVMRKMRIGQLHGAALSSGALAALYPGVQLYSLPFLFRTIDEVRHIRIWADPVITKALDDKGMTVLGISEGGFAYLMSNTPLRTSVDLKQKRIWIPEGDVISQTVFEESGVAPVSLPISDVYTGLQTGLIDTVGVNPSGAIALQWHTKLNHVVDEPLLFIMGFMVVDKRVFDRLSPPDQKILQEVIAATFQKLDERSWQDNIASRQVLYEGGVEFVALAAEERRRWQDTAKRAIARLVENQLYPQELLDTVRSKLASYRSKQAAVSQ